MNKIIITISLLATFLFTSCDQTTEPEPEVLEKLEILDFDLERTAFDSPNSQYTLYIKTTFHDNEDKVIEVAENVHVSIEITYGSNISITSEEIVSRIIEGETRILEKFYALPNNEIFLVTVKIKSYQLTFFND